MLLVWGLSRVKGKKVFGEPLPLEGEETGKTINQSLIDIR